MSFQVIIMVGGISSRMFPLETKALLPIENQPMIFRCIENLIRNNLTEIMIIADASYKNLLIDDRLNDIDICWMDDTNGTADSLRQVKDKIKKDFIVISVDFVTDTNLNDFINFHLANNSTATTFICDKPTQPEAGLTEHHGLVGNKLVFYSTERELIVKNSLLRRLSNIVIHTNLRSGHLFIFKKMVADLITDDIYSIRFDLIPFLVKRYDCFAYVSSGMRINTIANYREINNRIKNNLIDDSTIIGDMTTVKKSVIGKHCVIGNKVKIFNCIIMDYVTIKDGVILQNVIASNNSVFNEHVKLKNCEMGPGEEA